MTRVPGWEQTKAGRRYLEKHQDVVAQQLRDADEDEICKAFWNWWLNESGYCGLVLAFHVPNGGMRHRGAAGKLKAMGTLRGVADYLFLEARDGYHGLALEMKAEKRWHQSDEQKAFELRAEDAGYRYELAIGLDAAKEAVCRYLK